MGKQLKISCLSGNKLVTSMTKNTSSEAYVNPLLRLRFLFVYLVVGDDVTGDKIRLLSADEAILWLLESVELWPAN
jgi:hypothetical protein